MYTHKHTLPGYLQEEKGEDSGVYFSGIRYLVACGGSMLFNGIGLTCLDPGVAYDLHAELLRINVDEIRLPKPMPTTHCYIRLGEDIPPAIEYDEFFTDKEKPTYVFPKYSQRKRRKAARQNPHSKKYKRK